MTMCQARATDRLLRQLLDEHDLCLLSNALTPEELSPGMVVTLSRARTANRPVRRPFGAVFSPELDASATAAPYVPLILSERTGALTAELLAKTAGMLGKVSPSDFSASLKASGARTFDIQLGDARRSSLDDHKLGRHLRTARFTDVGRELADDGNAFYLVRSVVTAVEVLISGGEETSTALEAQLKDLLDGKSRVARSSAAQISMAPLAEGAIMVIGFSASEIVEHPDSGFMLFGMDRPLKKLDDGPSTAIAARAEIFSANGEDPIASITLA